MTVPIEPRREGEVLAHEDRANAMAVATGSRSLEPRAQSEENVNVTFPVPSQTLAGVRSGRHAVWLSEEGHGRLVSAACDAIFVVAVCS